MCEITDIRRSAARRRGSRALLALCFGLAQCLVSTAVAAAPIMPASPDYAWLFDDASGSTATAQFGGADGALIGDAGWSTDVAAPLGYAGNHSLLLDGAGDFVDVPGLSTALNGSSAFSISLWVRSDATGQDRAFFSGATPDNSDSMGGRYDANGWLNGNNGTSDLIKFSLLIGGVGYQYESSAGYQTTAWQHIAFTWQSGLGPQLYVDGVLDTPTAVSTGFGAVTGTIQGQSEFLIGNGPKNVWQGRLDEVSVWSSALSQENVEWLATNSLTTVPEPTSALLVGLGLAWLGGARKRRGIR